MLVAISLALLMNFCPLYFNCFCRSRIKCSYADASVKDDSKSATIDVVADIRTERVCILNF